jgi:hypothetical protein
MFPVESSTLSAKVHKKNCQDVPGFKEIDTMPLSPYRRASSRATTTLPLKTRIA